MCSPVKFCLWLKKTPNHKILLPSSHVRETGHMSLKDVMLTCLPGLPGNSVFWGMGGEGPSQFIPSLNLMLLLLYSPLGYESFLSLTLGHLLQQQTATSLCGPWLRNISCIQSPFPPRYHCSCCAYFCTLKTLVLLASLLNNRSLYCIDCLPKG